MVVFTAASPWPGTQDLLFLQGPCCWAVATSFLAVGLLSVVGFENISVSSFNTDEPSCSPFIVPHCFWVWSSAVLKFEINFVIVSSSLTPYTCGTTWKLTCSSEEAALLKEKYSSNRKMKWNYNYNYKGCESLGMWMLLAVFTEDCSQSIAEEMN